MVAFQFLFIAILLVTILLLCLVGVFLWRNVLNETSDFQPISEDSTTSTKQKPASASAPMIETEQILKSKTVSSAETISNQNDDDVVELRHRRLSSQKTVENAGDASVSMDDEQE